MARRPRKPINIVVKEYEQEIAALRAKEALRIGSIALEYLGGKVYNDKALRTEFEKVGARFPDWSDARDEKVETANTGKEPGTG